MSMPVPFSRANITSHLTSSLKNSGSKTDETNDGHRIQRSVRCQCHGANKGIIATYEVEKAHSNFAPSPSG